LSVSCLISHLYSEGVRINTTMADVKNYTTNVFLRSCAVKSIHGRMGDIVFVYRNGKQHARPYVRPRNPKTRAQRARRSVFAKAISAWQALSAQEKSLWNTRARRKNRTGYNLFISNYLRTARIRPMTARASLGTMFRMQQYMDEGRTQSPIGVVVEYINSPGTANRASPVGKVA
jgi:hypothetical protein